MNVVLIALGGAAGAVARYLLGGWLQTQLGGGFPYGTFAVNVLGSPAIGLVFGIVGRGALQDSVMPFLTAGFLCGFTTFSAFSYETVRLLEKGAAAAALNALGQVSAGVLAVYAGFALARLFVA